MSEERIRARVLKVTGNQAQIGVFVEGFWHRVIAETRIPLQPGDWIEGFISWDSETGALLFKIDTTSIPKHEEEDPYDDPGRLDLEA